MENPEANPQAGQQGQDGQMQQVMQMVQQMLQQGAQPVEVAQKLLQEQMPPEAIMEVFTQMGMPPEEAQAAIQQAMQGGQQPQGQGEEQMEGQASNPQEEAIEGAPQGGQPSPEEMAMMQQQQQGAPPMPGMAQGGAAGMQAQADALTAQVQQMMQQGATPEQVQQQLVAAVKNGEIDEQVGAYVLQQLQGDQQQAPVARFGGNARALIQKALGGGMPEVDSTSNSYIQDRQAAFVKTIKKNALLNDFENEFPSLKKSAPKFTSGGPNAADYATAAEYQVAMYKYNNAETDKTKHLNIDDLASKWSAPIKDGASGKWVGGKFVADAEPSIAEGASGKWIGGKFVQDAATNTGANQSQYFNNTPEQQNFARLQASPFGQLLSNSGWDHGDMRVSSSGMPLTNDPNAKFTVTHGEAKKGIFGRRKVAFDLDWSTAGNTGNAPGSIPVAPGSAPGITEKKVGDQTLRFDKMGNPLSASKYNPNNFVSAEQAKKDDDLYAQYQADKTYDPMTGKFKDVQTDRTGVNDTGWTLNPKGAYSEKNPLGADDVKALQATMGVPETGVWDAGFTTALKTYQKSKGLPDDGTIGPKTGAALSNDYTSKGLSKITSANPNVGLANDYQNFTQFDANAKIKTATDAATSAASKAAIDKLVTDKQSVLTNADAAYAQKGRLYRAFHEKPSENAREYQAELDATKAEEERQRALDAANPYTGDEAVSTSSTNSTATFPSLTAKNQAITNTVIPVVDTKSTTTSVVNTPAEISTVNKTKDNEKDFETANGQTEVVNSNAAAVVETPGAVVKTEPVVEGAAGDAVYNDDEYGKHSSAWNEMPKNSPPEIAASEEYWNKFLLPQVDAKNKRETDALNTLKTKAQKDQSIVKGTPTADNEDGYFTADGKNVYYDKSTGKYREYAFGGPSDDVVQSAMHILKMALGGMTYKDNYDFLPKAIDGTGFIPMPDSELEDMDFGTPVDETLKPKTEAELQAEYEKGYNERIKLVDPKLAGDPIGPTSGKGKVKGKSKLKVSWGDAFAAANDGMERFGNWTDQMYRNTPDKNMAMNSAMNTTRTGMNDAGNFNQWGENEGGINRGDQINNMGNTYGSMDLPIMKGWNSEVIKSAMGGPMTFEYGGKVYDLGGAYDLTDADVLALEAAGIKLERNI